MAKSSKLFCVLEDELDRAAERLGVKSILIMSSQQQHMKVEASGGQFESVYTVGAEGEKSIAGPDIHELYCERVVESRSELFVLDSRQSAEWSGNADEIEFGLVNYLGFPVKNRDGSIYGTVCVLHDAPRDYSSEDRESVEAIRNRVERLLMREE
ncbi:GAF domain-containing protein [Paraburkholderia aspalathi]|uniref:GAF domain-containing protein n=1 Tax=Paraburkholderia aspalathi TaxID=1324617 RepID=A0A1I7ERL3_9BURK|nr:GAF domain-containing protein [Paraburkholderia aspalathi]SFU26557.1 GAF domain-containing protein [Paraburkholderia aspalathi]